MTAQSHDPISHSTPTVNGYLVDGKPVGAAPVVVKLSLGPHRIVGRYLEMREARLVVVTPNTHRVVLGLRNAKSSP